MDIMHRPHRSIWLLIVGISGISGLAWFANTYTPDSWQMIVILFTFIATIIRAPSSTSNNVRHILLITGGLLILLFLRLLGLREIIYPLLLLASSFP